VAITRRSVHCCNCAAFGSILIYQLNDQHAAAGAAPC
jgi:hypothetical protein